MKRIPLSVAVLLIALAVPAAAQDMTVDDVFEHLKKNPAPNSYKADMAVHMQSGGVPIDMEGTTWFDHGAMRMESAMQANGQPMELTVVVDRDGMQWMETRMPSLNMTQVMKMDTSVLKDGLADLPGMDLMGQGGMTVQFTPEMYDAWREAMDLTYEGAETVNGKETYVLAGTYKDEYLDKLDPNGNMRRMNAMPERTVFYIEKESSLPIRMRMESAQGANGTVDLTNVELNPDLDADLFNYTPPEGVTPVDLTEMMRQQMDALRGGAGAAN